LEVVLNWKLDKEGPLPLLGLVSLTALVSPGIALWALLVTLAEGNLAVLAVLVDAGLVVRTSKESQ